MSLLTYLRLDHIDIIEKYITQFVVAILLKHEVEGVNNIVRGGLGGKMLLQERLKHTDSKNE
jgi:uncharacterized hydantoinase/oxoprolinase family protein